MQAISTMRWPSDGSKPVVSVSSTISRMNSVCSPGLIAASAQSCQAAGELAPGDGAAQPRGHGEIGAAALDLDGKLPGQDGLEPLLAHAGARQHPRALEKARRPQHRHRVATPIPPGLVEQ